MTVLLAQAVGLRRALELSLTGNFLTADEAFGLGLANHVVPHAELLPFAHRLATDIVSDDQRCVRRLLAHYRALANTATLDEAHLLEGILAETWRRDPGELASRRRAVTSRGRAQTGS